LSDLKREVAEYPIAITENENDSGITAVRHEVGSTSAIAYVNFGVDLSQVSVDNLPLLPLFSKIMTQTGAGEYDSVALSRRIGTHTGGLGVSLMTTAVHPEGADESVVVSGENMRTQLIIQGKATSEKIDELLSIYKLVLTDAKLDSQSRIIEMLKENDVLDCQTIA
jgi:Zn-dependent M16 (insulinase) family peptidase